MIGLFERFKLLHHPALLLYEKILKMGLDEEFWMKILKRDGLIEKIIRLVETESLLSFSTKKELLYEEVLASSHYRFIGETIPKTGMMNGGEKLDFLVKFIEFHGRMTGEEILDIQKRRGLRFCTTDELLIIGVEYKDIKHSIAIFGDTSEQNGCYEAMILGETCFGKSIYSKKRWAENEWDGEYYKFATIALKNEGKDICRESESPQKATAIPRKEDVPEYSVIIEDTKSQDGGTGISLQRLNSGFGLLESLARILLSGNEPAGINELIKFGIEEYPRKRDFPVIALRDILRDRRGCRRVAALSASKKECELVFIYADEKFNSNAKFVCKTLAKDKIPGNREAAFEMAEKMLRQNVIFVEGTFFLPFDGKMISDKDACESAGEGIGFCGIAETIAYGFSTPHEEDFLVLCLGNRWTHKKGSDVFACLSPSDWNMVIFKEDNFEFPANCRVAVTRKRS